MRHSLLVALTMALVPAAALAIDGQVLINMSTVSAAGGFPYTIAQAGSYKLSGNLTVPNGDTTAIVIAHDNVTLDLNGYQLARKDQHKLAREEWRVPERLPFGKEDLVPLRAGETIPWKLV